MRRSDDRLIVNVEGNPSTGEVVVWINGVDMTPWVANDVQIIAQAGFRPSIKLELSPDRLWYETMKRDDDGQGTWVDADGKESQ